MDNQYCIKEALFQRLKFIDTELAEDLHRRMPEVKTVTELNTFFHQFLALYQENTFQLREALRDTDFITWYIFFNAHIVPFLVHHRLPPMTNTKVDATYHDNLVQAAQSLATSVG